MTTSARRRMRKTFKMTFLDDHLFDQVRSVLSKLPSQLTPVGFMKLCVRIYISLRPEERHLHLTLSRADVILIFKIEIRSTSPARVISSLFALHGDRT